jgi:protein TonB
MAGYRRSNRGRAGAALGVAAVHVALALMLLGGSGSQAIRAREAALATFEVVPPVPPPPLVVAAPARKRSAAATAASPGLRATPTPVSAPKPIVPPPLPLPAPVEAADGAAPSVGAAPVAGPGTGAGGIGDGTGSGTRGAGSGAGGSEAKLIRGGIVNRDYPSDARRARLAGSVTVRFTVGIDGRASGCAVTRSSGVGSLDEATCRLIEKRFRYQPARDAAGRPVAEERGWRQRWWIEGAPSPESGGEG